MEKRRKIRASSERSSPGIRNRRASRTIFSDEDETEDARNNTVQDRPRSTFSLTPGAIARSNIADAVNTSNEPLEVQKLQAELEVAEAELKAARLKYRFIQAKEASERGGPSRVG